MNITIIGGSGFVGTRLVRKLLSNGYIVKIADKRCSVTYPELWQRCDIRNLPNGKEEFPESITDKLSAPGKHAEAQRLQPMHSLIEVLKGSDIVINLAAEHRDDVTPISLYDDVNVKGSENICNACYELGIKKIIFTSSVAVYGFAPAGTDESGEINYFNDYGRTKYLAEGKYREWLKQDPENSVTIIRPTVIFGEQNRGNVYNLLKQIANGHFPMVGSGKNRKSMNYVENVAAFLEYELSHDIEPGEHLYNYCDEPAYDMNNLVLDVYKFLGKPKKSLFHFSYKLAYCGGKCFDLLAYLTHKKFTISSIRIKKFTQNTYFTSSNIKKTSFIPPVKLEDGLKRTIEYEFVNKVQGHTFNCE
ncbi:MAG: NAD-dependent epimerase/dehydratase family protein [Paludibacteraceae bacterium]|nr:NAD-dependent epimerase/dehydratase family protein [Paludibacteraceae bacterium]